MNLFNTNGINYKLSGYASTWMSLDGNYVFIDIMTIDKDGNSTFVSYDHQVFVSDYFTISYASGYTSFYAKKKMIHNGNIYDVGDLVETKFATGGQQYRLNSHFGFIII